MALWRCSHCGTLQPVAARCWVCRRSSTSCGTCLHYRASVAARIGYCGLDRDRQPLAGSEIRACWDGVTLAEASGPTAEVVATPVTTAAATPGGYMGGFVPVETLIDATLESPLAPDPAVPRETAERSTPPPPPPPMPVVAAQPDGLLWGDLEG